MSMLEINFNDFYSMLPEYGNVIPKSDVCGLKEQPMHLKYKGAGFNSYYLKWDSFTITYADNVLNNPMKIHFDSEQETVEMYFILSGNSKTNFNHLLNPFCMDSNQHNIFFYSGMKGYSLWNSKYYKVLGINLNPRFFQKYLPEGSKFDDFKLNILNKRNKFIHHQNYPITPKMMVLIQDIIHCKLQGHFRKIYLESKVLEVLFLQLDQIENHKDALKLSSREIERMHFAKRYIEDNVYTEYAGFSLAMIARACQTNEFYLKRNFKYVFGTTVFDYIRQLKMERSKMLIKEQNLNINEISEMIGYKNPQHFSIAFKRYFGFAPSRLRD